MEYKHIPVLLNETIENLNIKEDGIYIDCTLGGGGHSREILKRLSNKGLLIGIDQDIDAINFAKKKLSEYDNKIFVHDNFYNIDSIIKSLNIGKVDGILMDLGVSSFQLDIPERGFSYMNDAPLDMRMNRESDFSAYDVVNKYDETKLRKIIENYGEERFAKNISHNIVKYRKLRPIETTYELVDIIKASIPAKFKRTKHHPAKKTFQAIRIEVNGELKILDKAIDDSIKNLKPQGRIAIITFHSLEDRIVKDKFKFMENPCTCPKDFPMCVCGKKPELKRVTKKPITASKCEIDTNPRSRSAKLRVGEKI